MVKILWWMMGFHYSQTNHKIRVVLLILYTLLHLLWDFHASRISPLSFAIFTLTLYIIYPPKYIFSPKNILFAYYFIWFSFPVAIGERYRGLDFELDYVFLSYFFLQLTYFTGFVALSIFREKIALSFQSYFDEKRLSLWIAVNIFIILLLLFVFILSTGGIGVWLNDPGNAFLTRGGSGMIFLPFILLLTLNSYLLGLYSLIKKKKYLLVLNVMFILSISPFIGSKSRLIILILLSVMPYIGRSRLSFINASCVFFPCVFLFFLGLYFRNSSWITTEKFLPYAVNYFDTFESLYIGIRDFEGDLFRTVFLPFNKILTINGSREGVFYDMSSWLTSIYYPWVYDMRATVQWPVEMDLYLSFNFYFGLPIIFLVFLSLSILYQVSFSDKVGGVVFIYSYMFFYTLSHLRGGLILWTDFYLIPFLVLSVLCINVFFFRKIRIIR